LPSPTSVSDFCFDIVAPLGCLAGRCGFNPPTRVEQLVGTEWCFLLERTGP
jgi:hypothetical protein